MDVELQNWRGVVAPKGISPEQEKALEDLLVDMTRTPAWQDTWRAAAGATRPWPARSSSSS